MKKLLKPVVRKLVLSTCWLLISMNFLHAEVVTDGTLGQAAPLTGPNFQINSDLGQQKGGNLFHSFSLFNVNAGETATFAGPESVTNILARVTGGQSSFINGTLRSTIPNANLYLLNPSGILFGGNARLDISGSFHASTADYVNLGEEGRFYTKDVIGNQSILTVAPPSAFGFLNNQAASISIRGSVLETTEGKTLSLSGGDISITGAARLFAPRGEINLTSETSGDISMEGESWLFAPDGKIDLASFGSIHISNSYVDVSGDGYYYGGEIGGKISILANQLFIHDSELYAQGQGFGKGGNLTIAAGSIHISNSYVDVSGVDVSGDGYYYSGGIGGEISIFANQLFIHDSELYTQGFRSGNLTIVAPIFTMDNSILVANSWSGEGGDISISSDQFMLSENNTIVVSSKLSMGGRPFNISVRTAERLASHNTKSSPSFSKSDSLSLSRCGGSSENQSRFVITASDIPQETPYDLQTHWVLPRYRN